MAWTQRYKKAFIIRTDIRHSVLEPRVSRLYTERKIEKLYKDHHVESPLRYQINTTISE